MMLKDASKLDKVLGTEDISEYMDFELIQSGFVAKSSKYARKCFLLWIGLEPPLQVADFRAALLTAPALFFCPSLVHVCRLALNKLYCVQSIILILP